MAAQTTSNPTIPPTLTVTQAQALLQALLSRTSNSSPAHRATSSPAAPKLTTARPSRQPRPQSQQVQTHNITIDASTRIMGHCNNIHLSSLSSTEQAPRIDELVRGALAGLSREGGAINVSVNAGVNVMGSKNVIVLGSSANCAEALGRNGVGSGCTLPTGMEEGGSGRKRRAEDCVGSDERAGKKVKLEEGSKEGVGA